jgi:hypothetical protein
MANKIKKSVWNWVERTGYAMAASRLATAGYHEEAKNLMLEMKRVKND